MSKFPLATLPTILNEPTLALFVLRVVRAGVSINQLLMRHTEAQFALFDLQSCTQPQFLVVWSLVEPPFKPIRSKRGVYAVCKL